MVCLLSITSFAGTQDQKSCEYRVFNIRVAESVSIKEVINQLSSMCNFSITIKDPQANSLLKTELAGVNIKDLTLHEVFDLLLEENNLNYEYQNNILRITALETKTFRLDYITSIRQGTAIMNASVSATPTEEGSGRDLTAVSENEIRVSEEFNFWETLDAEITAILNNGLENYVAPSPIINHKAGLITITGTKSQLDRVSLYLDDLKSRLHKQVMIDVSVISVGLNESQTTGIDWSKFQLGINIDQDGNSKPSSTATFQNVTNDVLSNYSKNINIVNSLTFSMEGLLNFLKSNGDTKVMSSPKVITMNNQQALITVGDNINYRIQEDTSSSEGDNISVTYNNYSIFIGVLLNLLPEISDENEIMLRINPSISSFKYDEDDSKQDRFMAPDTTEKKLSTVARVRSGDTIILGGLIENQNGVKHTNVPVLSEIPLFGNAFKSKSNTFQSTELVFVITPYIISEETNHVQTLKDLGFSKSLYEH
jgi:general secretion pathway protein D